MAERKRIGVPISGLDSSTPDHSVVDGKCKTLHNLRYTGEAWRNVKELEGKEFGALPTTEYGELRIVYKHPADADYAYICEATNDDGTKTLIRALWSAENNNWDTHLITSLDATLDYKYFHFGTIIIISNIESLNLQYFILDNGVYREYIGVGGKRPSVSMSISIPKPESIDYDAEQDELPYNKHGYADFTRVVAGQTIAEQTVIATEDNSFQFGSGQVRVDGTSFSKPDLFRGEFLAIAVARNRNGGVIAVSELCLFNSVVELYKFCNTYYYGHSNSAKVLKTTNGAAKVIQQSSNIMLNSASLPRQLQNAAPHFFVCEAEANIQIENVSEDIASVSIYSTRLFNLFEQKGGGFADNSVDLFRESLYLMADIKIDDFKNGTHTKIINYTDFENIEHQPLYEPSQTPESLWGEYSVEYNNRIALLNVIQKLNLANSVTPYFPVVEYGNTFPTEQPTNIMAKIWYGSETIIQQESFGKKKFVNTSAQLSPKYFVLPMEVESVWLYNTVLLPPKVNYKFPLKYSALLNVSYYYKLDDIFSNPNRFNISATGETLDGVYIAKEKYLGFFKDKSVIDEDLPNANRKNIRASNRVQFSEENDPYSFPYANSYRIGSQLNEIIAVNSGAIEMSDSKFGEFPLYVFTKEGIFAMQSGKDTLYSAIVPINYDVIINPNTLAVNGAVLYFTDKGLHALTNQGAKLLSAPIHTAENRIPEWMYTTQMVYLPEWNEVLCTDIPNKKAYVFSLDNNVWSTRDIPEGYILNNDELVAADSNIYNLRNEKEQGSDGVSISLTTRPIKLGSMELKRAETIIVRFECATDQALNVKVEGSIDTQNWGELRNIQTTTNKDILIRRTPCSVKYLRFTIEGNVTDDIRILAFELEYYNRMRHRMR